VGHLLDQQHHQHDDAGRGHDHHHHHPHDHGSGPWGRLTHTVSELLGGHSHDSAEQVDEALSALVALGLGRVLGC